MSLKTFKSYTKSSRGTVLVNKSNLWKGKPLKSLTYGKISTGGRNNLGRITSRSKGASTAHSNHSTIIQTTTSSSSVEQQCCSTTKQLLSTEENNL